MKAIKIYFALIITALFLYACDSGAVAKDDLNKEPLVVFLVRHAEKIDNSRDPELSEEGKERALILANTLKDSGIEYIHSSDFLRTRETAAPLSNELSLKIEIYDPRKLEDFAKSLKQKRGRHLIVGHSNTTPQLVELLGGSAGSEINEKSEYDRLYIVSDSGNGRISTIRLSYGKAYKGEGSQK